MILPTGEQQTGLSEDQEQASEHASFHLCNAGLKTRAVRQGKKINKGHQGGKGVNSICQDLRRPCALALGSGTEGSTRSSQRSQVCSHVPGRKDDE